MSQYPGFTDSLILLWWYNILFVPVSTGVVCCNYIFSDTLRKVINDEEVIQKLSYAVHSNVEVHDDLLNQISNVILPKELNIWIDPIGV